MKTPQLNSHTHSLTKQFLNIVSSPFVDQENVDLELIQLDECNISKLYEYASKNRMRLLFLDSLNKVSYQYCSYSKLFLFRINYSERSFI